MVFAQLPIGYAEQHPWKVDKHEAHEESENRSDVAQQDVAYYASDDAEEYQGGDNQLREWECLIHSWNDFIDYCTRITVIVRCFLSLSVVYLRL